MNLTDKEKKHLLDVLNQAISYRLTNQTRRSEISDLRELKRKIEETIQTSIPKDIADLLQKYGWQHNAFIGDCYEKRWYSGGFGVQKFLSAIEILQSRNLQALLDAEDKEASLRLSEFHKRSV